MLSEIIGGSVLGIILGCLSSAGITCLREKLKKKDKEEYSNFGGGEWGLIIPAILMCISFPFFVFSGEYTFLGIGGILTTILLQMRY